jgi:hypothetical protein
MPAPSPCLRFAPLFLLAAGCGHSCDDHDDGGSRTVVVSEESLGEDGVEAFSTPGSTGSTTFEFGPETPPRGDGSVEFQTGADGNSGEELRFDVLDDVRLDQVTQLSYWTYVDQGSGGQAPYLILRLDWDGNGTQDDLIFFEPDYQHGYTTDVPDQGDLLVDEWQSWDALRGGWWSVNDPVFGPGADVGTLEEYLAAHANATVVPGTDGSGGLRLVVGYGAPAWNDFVGNADALEVGVLGGVTTYDFEP